MPSSSWDVNGQARRALQVIVRGPALGPEVLSRPQMMANVLKDLLPDSPREASMLVGAAEAHIPGMLHGNLSQGLDPETAVRLAAATFAERAPFAPEACDWVVGELAIALGIDPALITKPHPQAAATAQDTVVTGGAAPGYPAPGQQGSAPAGFAPGTADPGWQSPPAADPRWLPATPAPGPGRRNKALAWASAAVVAVVVVAAIIFFATRPSGPIRHGVVRTSRVHVYSGASYGFKHPWAIALAGPDAWVANYGGNSVTELNAATGHVVRILSAGSYGFNQPWAIAVNGPDIWVVNTGGNSVTELNASDGSVVRVLSGGTYGFDRPDGIAFAGNDAWVSNYNGSAKYGSPPEFNASDGGLIRTGPGRNHGFSGPEALVATGGHLWVANGGGTGSVSQLKSSDGSHRKPFPGGEQRLNPPHPPGGTGGGAGVCHPRRERRPH